MPFFTNYHHAARETARPDAGGPHFFIFQQILMHTLILPITVGIAIKVANPDRAACDLQNFRAGCNTGGPGLEH